MKGNFMKNDLVLNTEKTFEKIKHIDENGLEFWCARELMVVLGYSKWGNFENVVDKAKESCKNSNISVIDHFADISKMVEIGSGAKREQIDIKLTRYACYLIAQNGASSKKQIALAQTYFAVKTRQQELTEEEYKQLSEDDRRLYNRKVVTDRNKINYLYFKL